MEEKLTKVIVDSGICGFITSIRADRIDRKRISVQISSDCEQTSKLAGLLDDLKYLEVFKHGDKSRVNTLAIQCHLHPSCPVPVAILKAVEVEAGLALAKDVSILFIKDPKQ